MADRMTPDHRRRVQEAQRKVADPATQRQLEAAQALMSHPRIREMSQTLADGLAAVLRPALAFVNSIVNSVDWDRVREFLRTASEALARLLPPNARALGTTYWPKLQTVAQEEQLCLSWVPEPDLARELLDAEDGVQRERLLVASAEAVLSSCERSVREAVEMFDVDQAALNGPDDPDNPVERLAADQRTRWAALDETRDAEDRQRVVEVADLLQRSIDAAVGGHFEAAQALATCVTDTLFEQYINERRGRTHNFLKFRLGQTKEAQFISLVIGPTLAAAESSFRQQGSWPTAPRGNRAGAMPYSRHGSVHGVRSDIFTEATSLKAIVLATSVLRLSMSPLLFVCFQLLDAAPPLSSGDDV